MIHKYKKIYQTTEELIVPICVEWISFGYNQPNGGCIDGTTSFSFDYLDCSNQQQEFNITVGCVDEAYELIVPLCVKPNSVVPKGSTSGAVTNIQYGEGC